jgi:hypothetical protein
VVFLFLCGFVALIGSLSGFAQEDLPKGSIEGTIIDAVGAPVAGAAVYLNSHSAEVPLTLTTDKDGKYSTGALNAGVYTVQVELRNYNANRFFVTVRDGKTSNGDRKLTPIEPGTPMLQGRVSRKRSRNFPSTGAMF